MKAIKYWLQYLAVVSLFLLMVSGIYDIAAGIKASNWYLHWHREQYGPIPLPSAIFTYALGLLRGTAAVFGCGLVGLMQVSKRRIRASYMLFLAFWTAEYTLAVVSKAYKGIQPDSAIQMLAALFCFTAMAIQYVIHFKHRRV